jgi:hypothetical protein
MLAHNNTINMLEDKSDANTESYDRLVRWDELAGQLALQGRFQESAAAIERLFAGGGGPQNKESARLLDAARRLFVTCQEKLAEQNLSLPENPSIARRGVIQSCQLT